MNGLAKHTEKVFERISKLESIKPYLLVGGTALSLQIGKRLSEDLDFMKWKTGSQDKPEVAWYKINKELESIGFVESVDVLDFDMVEFVFEGVKLSFYSAPRTRPIHLKELPYLNNIRLADVESIGVMKMEVLLRRNTFRDYYDIYSILKEGYNLHNMIAEAIIHSNHRLKEKSILMILTNSERFKKDSRFKYMQPFYDVTPEDIQDYIIQLLHCHM